MKNQLYQPRIVTLLFILICMKGQLLCSPQSPDYLIYKGDTLAIYNLILEQHLNQIQHDSIEALFGLSFRSGSSFKCWRGYQAIYEISNDSLYLIAMVECGELSDSKTFDKQNSNQKIIQYFPTAKPLEKSIANGILERYQYQLANC